MKDFERNKQKRGKKNNLMTASWSDNVFFPQMQRFVLLKPALFMSNEISERFIPSLIKKKLRAICEIFMFK